MFIIFRNKHSVLSIHISSYIIHHQDSMLTSYIFDFDFWLLYDIKAWPFKEIDRYIYCTLGDFQGESTEQITGTCVALKAFSSSQQKQHQEI